MASIKNDQWLLTSTEQRSSTFLCFFVAKNYLNLIETFL